MIADGSGIVDLVKAHHVRDDLFVDIILPIALDEVHEDVDGTACLVAEDLARSDVVGGDNICWFVFLHVSELAACFLELTIEDVKESSIEANQDSDHRCLLIDTFLVWHFT